jgi:hypothetical protein
MEQGEVRFEKASRFVGEKFDGIEWHVYRMGRLTDYFIGSVRCVNGKWRVETDKPTPASEGRFPSRKAAVTALCSADDRNLL